MLVLTTVTSEENTFYIYTTEIWLRLQEKPYSVIIRNNHTIRKTTSVKLKLLSPNKCTKVRYDAKLDDGIGIKMQMPAPLQ